MVPFLDSPTCIRQTPEESSRMNIGILGQAPNIHIFTPVTYIFAIEDDNQARRDHIAQTLKDGLDRLGALFPWVAGQVVMDDSTGQYCFAPIDGATGPKFEVAELAYPASFEELQAAGYPFDMLEEANVASRRTFPGQPDEAHLREMNVFMVKACFIKGGLLLTFTAHHAVMDMTGQGEIVRWLSKLCRGDALTEEELVAGNCDRRPVIPELGPEVAGDDPFKLIPDQVIQPTADVTEKSEKGTEERKDPIRPTEPASGVWRYFNFSAASLSALKKEALATLPKSEAAFVSTNDAFTAFLWRSIVRARLDRIDPATTPSTLSRAIDMRRYLDVSPSFPGLFQNMTNHTFPAAQEVADASLGELAAHLRKEINKEKLALRTRALITCYIHFPKRSFSEISFIGAVDTIRAGYMLSSWANVPYHTAEMDFGFGIGVARAVRRPCFTPTESLGYMMPQAADGSIAVGLCLRESDLQNMCNDAEFSKYGTCQ